MRDGRWVAALLAVGACSGRPDWGRITGEAYVALASGAQVDVDARTVRVLPDSAWLDDALSKLCASRQRELSALTDSSAENVRAASEHAWAARDRVIAARVLPVRVRAGPHGRFAVDSIGRGKYRLWANAVVNGEHWSWLAPVEVRGGDTVRVNLSNENADDDPFRCQWRPPPRNRSPF